MLRGIYALSRSNQLKFRLVMIQYTSNYISYDSNKKNIIDYVLLLINLFARLLLLASYFGGKRKKSQHQLFIQITLVLGHWWIWNGIPGEKDKQIWNLINEYGISGLLVLN